MTDVSTQSVGSAGFSGLTVGTVGDTKPA